MQMSKKNVPFGFGSFCIEGDVKKNGRARSSLDTTSTSGGGVCLFMHVGTGRRRLAASQSPLIVLGLLAHWPVFENVTCVNVIIV